MARAARSGNRVTPQILALILGMVNRGDRNHDIAAWFGLNEGRIKDAKDGKFGPAQPKSTGLPPSGSPGPRAQELRAAVAKAMKSLAAPDPNLADILSALKTAAADFDKHV